jgi:CheY-like chemotaxis protein
VLKQSSTSIYDGAESRFSIPDLDLPGRVAEPDSEALTELPRRLALEGGILMDGQPPRRSPRRASILIMDDHAIARSGLRRLLASAKDLAVIGEAVDGREALELGCRLRPDVVLMDVRMPDLDGIAATRMLKQDLPTTSVIMVIMYQNADYLYQAIKLDAEQSRSRS